MADLALPAWLLALGAPAEFLLKVTALLCVGALASRLLRRHGAASRHAAWTLGIVAVLLLPLASLVVPSVNVTLPVSAATAGPQIQHSLAGSADGFGARELAVPRDARVVAPAAIARKAPAAAPSPAVPAASTPRAVLLAYLLAGAWAVGSVLFGVRYGLAHRRARRMAREGECLGRDELLSAASALGLGPSRRLRLVASAEARVPLTFGWRAPVIAVPRDFPSWSPERREAVLLHELAHVRRGDWLVQALGEACRALLWFHPLAHLALKRLRAEAEQAADDLVLQLGTRPSAYASLLLDIARSIPSASRSSAMTVSMIGDPFDVRIRAILDAARARGPVSRLVRASLTALMAFALFAASAVDVSAEPKRETFGEHLRRAYDAHVAWIHDAVRTEDAYDEGLRLHHDGRFDEAREAFERAIREGRRVGAATYNIACGHALQGRATEALDWLERAADAGFDLSGYLSKDGDLASLRGEPRFRALLAEHADVDALAGLRKRFDALEQGSDESSSHAEWVTLSLQLHGEGDHERAARGFERAARLEPEDPTPLYNVACAQAMKGDEAAALDAFRRAIEAGWKDADLARSDSDLATLRGLDAFDALLRDAELLAGPSGMKVFGFAVPGVASDWKAAASRHEEFVARHPQSGAGWFQLGLSSLRAGDAVRGIEAFLRAHELGFRRGGVTAYNVACSLAVAGRPDEAFEWLAISSTEGFDVASQAHGDDDLASLRSDARFAPYASPWPARGLRRLITF